jgi:two-component system response regulator AtoC
MKNKEKILVVDDDKAILKSLVGILTKNGYAVETASTAVEALEKTESSHYDAMLLDICLPDMEGIDLLPKLPENSSDMVKIIITGHSDDEHGIKASDYGADDYLVKPVKVEELLNTIKERLEDLKNKKINAE